MSILNYQQWPNNSSNVQYQALKQVLDRAHAMVCLDKACDTREIQRQMGAAVNLRRWVNGVVSTTPVVEGVNNASRSLTYTDYTGTMLRYAEQYETSRYNYDLNPYDAVMGSKDVIQDLVKSDRERIRYNAAIGGTNVLYNSAAISTRQTVNGPISLGRLQVAVRAILAAKGEPFTGIEGGQNKEGTSPVEAALYAFCHTDLQPDLRNLPGFKTVAEYPSGKGMDYEFGAVQNIRFFTTPEIVSIANGASSVSSSTLISTGTTGTTAGAPDVYPIILAAKHALTSIKLAGGGKGGFGNANLRVLDQPDKSDGSNERILTVMDWYDLCMITAQEWMYRIEVGATRNPA